MFSKLVTKMKQINSHWSLCETWLELQIIKLTSQQNIQNLNNIID